MTFTREELHEAEKKARSACMVVLNPSNDGSMLAVTRRKDFADIGLPGGKIDIDQNEHALTAAVRECYEETGIMVDGTSAIPLFCGMARTMECITYYAPRVLGGKLLQVSREGLPMWVHPHMLLKDACTYKHYNLIIINKMVEIGAL